MTELSGITLQKMISLKTEFPDMLYELENGNNETVKVRFNHFPFIFHGKIISIDDVTLSTSSGGTTSGSHPEAFGSDGITVIGWDIPVTNSNIHDGDVFVLLTYSLS